MSSVVRNLEFLVKYAIVYGTFAGYQPVYAYVFILNMYLV